MMRAKDNDRNNPAGATPEEALFIADRLDAAAEQQVIHRQETALPAPVIPADLGPYMRGQSSKQAAVQAALGQDLSLRRLYTGLLRGQNRWSVPKLAAADSGNVTSREGDNLKISMTPSKRDANQVYLRVTVTSMDAGQLNGPARLTVTWGDHDMVEQDIDDMMDGDAQILLDANDPLITALKMADSEFFLSPQA